MVQHNDNGFLRPEPNSMGSIQVHEVREGWYSSIARMVFGHTHAVSLCAVVSIVAVCYFFLQLEIPCVSHTVVTCLVIAVLGGIAVFPFRGGNQVQNAKIKKGRGKNPP